MDAKRVAVWSLDGVTLYRYASDNAKTSLPVLIVFATVNHPDILDLMPDCSFIRGLLQQGVDVYLLDWGNPSADSNIQFADYVLKYMQTAISNINADKINLIGICQGGVMSLCYAALYKNINRLVLISTPIDFQTEDNLIYQLIKEINIDALATDVPGQALAQFFITLRPFELLGKKYLAFMDKLNDEVATRKFLLIEKWLHDAPRQPRQAFIDVVQKLYQQNQLMRSEFSLAGHPVDLSHIQHPVLNVIATEDEIVPPSASHVLRKILPIDLYEEASFQAGHIGIYVSERVGKALPKMLASWLQK